MWRPLLRFALLGALIFAADRSFSALDREARAPIVISAARVAELREEVARWQGRAPTPEELQRALGPVIEEELLYREALDRGYLAGDRVIFARLVQNLRFAGADPERDDAALYREALDLGLHESDIVVRRRLVQRMRLDLEAAALAEPPAEAALRAHYEANRDAWRSPARVAFAQHYFERGREAAAHRALERLRAAGAAPGAHEVESDPFLHPVEQPPHSRSELADRFGAEFAEAVFAAEPGVWSGPVSSAYGLHLVHVREREPGRALSFEEVREPVRFAVLAERRERALREGVAALLAAAELRIEDPR